MFGFKEQVSPILEGKVNLIPIDVDKADIWFQLTNKARGPAIVEKISVMEVGADFEIEDNSKFPATILYNSGIGIVVHIKNLNVEKINLLQKARGGRPYNETLRKYVYNRL